MSPRDRAQVTDALNLQLLLVAFGDADHHVVDQRARQAVVGANFAFFRSRVQTTRLAVVFHLDGDLGPMRVLELAELAFDSHSAIGDVHFDAGWALESVFYLYET